MEANRCESKITVIQKIKSESLYKNKPQFFKHYQKNQGVTLIALIVTIIVILILAGVTITMVVGENGVINHIQQSSKRTKDKEENETKDLSELSGYADELLNEGNTRVEQVTDETPGKLAGTGAGSTPYLIESIEDLVQFSNEVAEGKTFEGQTVRLSVSLDFQSDLSYRNPQTTEFKDVNGDTKTDPLKTELTTGGGFNPIGDETHQFKGTFNGGEHAIKNLYINEKNNYVGLFGYTGEKSNIKNIIMTNVNITTTEKYAGGLVGYNNNGTIENVKTEGGTVKAKEWAGGIAGQNYNGGSIILCSNSANISENGVVDNTKYADVVIGGIVGFNYKNGIIKECINTGKIEGLNSGVGGIAGSSDTGGTIEKCQNKGDVSSTGKAAQNIAGIVGWTNGTIKGCENTGKVIGANNDVGGIVGDIKQEGATVISCTNEGIVQGNEHVGGIAGIAGETAKVKVANCTNNGKVIGNLQVGGIVGYLQNSSTVESSSNNGAITGAGKLTGTEDQTNLSRTGGIVGDCYNKSTIKNCYNNGKISTGKVEKPKCQLGGIAGTCNYNSLVYSCYNNGPVGGTGENELSFQVGGIVGFVYQSSSVSACFNLKEINGKFTVGGIVGLGGSGQISNETIENCYNVGYVTATDYGVGGILGFIYGSNVLDGSTCVVKNCYNVGKITMTKTNETRQRWYSNVQYRGESNYNKLLLPNRNM